MTVIELWWDVDVGICLGLLNPGLRGSSPVPCFILGHVLCGVGLLKMGLLKLLMALAFCSAEGYGVRQILIDTLNQVCLTLSWNILVKACNTMGPNLPKFFRYDMASSRYGILCHPLFFGFIKGILMKKKMMQIEDDIPGRLTRAICTLNSQIGQLSQQVHGMNPSSVISVDFPETQKIATH